MRLHRWHASIGLVLLLAVLLAWERQAAWSAPAQMGREGHRMHEGSVTTLPHTPSSFFMLLGIGLLTGLSHCVGMCGPLVGAFAMQRRAVQRDISTPLLLYHIGRLTTYTLLGAVVGGIGSIAAVVVREWQGLFSVALGLPVVLLGLGLLGLFPLQHWIAVLAPAPRLSQWIRNALRSSHPAAPIGLGMANGLLPCGAVYAIALLAALSGNALKGASFMLLFGLGTFPAMLSLGFFSGLLSLRLRHRLYRLAAALVVAVGLQLTLRGLALHGHISHTAIGGIMLW